MRGGAGAHARGAGSHVKRCAAVPNSSDLVVPFTRRGMLWGKHANELEVTVGSHEAAVRLSRFVNASVERASLSSAESGAGSASDAV